MSTSIVLEGGTFRPLFSAGVMDALLEAELMTDYCIGVSAGITNGVSYVSKQKGRNWTVVERYRHDKRYIGFGNFLKCRSLFGLDFVFHEIPNILLPFDMEAYQNNPCKVVVGLTNALTGEAAYMDGKKLDDRCLMLRATCAIPLYFPSILIDGIPYYDGGISEPIPIRKAQEDGNRRHLIVLTQPKGFVKQPSRQNALAYRLLKNKYPKLKEPLLNRHLRYNEEVRHCEELERQGNAIILRPKQPIDSFEKDVSKIRAAYDQGYEMAQERISDIAKLLKGGNEKTVEV